MEFRGIYTYLYLPEPVLIDKNKLTSSSMNLVSWCRMTNRFQLFQIQSKLVWPLNSEFLLFLLLLEGVHSCWVLLINDSVFMETPMLAVEFPAISGSNIFAITGVLLKIFYSVETFRYFIKIEENVKLNTQINYLEFNCDDQLYFQTRS